MVAAFVNPHDIMYGDANVPGEPPVQKPVTPACDAASAAELHLQKKWPTLAPSLSESLSAPGIPPKRSGNTKKVGTVESG